MKSLMMIVIAVSTVFIIQVASLEAALLPNEIAIRKSSLKQGTKFGEGWSKEQKMVWNKTQEFFQFRVVLDWDNLNKLFHKDAIIYTVSRKVPYDFLELEEVLKGRVPAVFYCTVHEIRIIENVAIVMLNYEVEFPVPPGCLTFVWMRQGADWKIITLTGKKE
ncbi:nuclear transport factor 2 family protein [Desulfobacula sp.]|uniref:nuclear transport factor 2 family protein n=1 Tax=Desulfobacula sp. TaxID=2593537 RepID=UPI0025BE2A86|nr:nuclear transport factor 2 family protein [Desulfobacula sp.]MBC2705239.1 nuclear transport factor 2 family protein [Desulfobacula sp.]